MAETRNAADYFEICRTSETGDAFAAAILSENGWQEVSVDFQSDERARQLYWQEGDVITPEFLISVSNFLNSKFRSISTPEKAERQLAEFNDPESFSLVSRQWAEIETNAFFFMQQTSNSLRHRAFWAFMGIQTDVFLHLSARRRTEACSNSHWCRSELMYGIIAAHS